MGPSATLWSTYQRPHLKENWVSFLQKPPTVDSFSAGSGFISPSLSVMEYWLLLCWSSAGSCSLCDFPSVAVWHVQRTPLGSTPLWLLQSFWLLLCLSHEEKIIETSHWWLSTPPLHSFSALWLILSFFINHHSVKKQNDSGKNPS